MTTTAVALRHPEDRLLKDQVAMHFRAARYTALRGIEFRVENGVVELFGDVPSFYFKQIAQTLVLGFRGVRGIKNELQVR
jgi:osmotically-inducible protein OsmY